MPRMNQKPEYNLPEIAYIRDHYTPIQLAEAKRRLCARCSESPCGLLPLTTKGEDCPYFEECHVLES